MRIVVATDQMGVLTSAEAGAAVGSGWAAADVEVVAMGEAGRGALQALADQVGGSSEPGADGGLLTTRLTSAGLAAMRIEGAGTSTASEIPYTASSGDLGRALRDLLRSAPAPRTVVDLCGLDVHDGGAGLLAALGATADVSLDDGPDGFAGITRLDLDHCRRVLGSTELVGLVPAAERDRPLLGLRGITVRRGRETGADQARMLATDAALVGLAGAAGVADEPGLGACGGLGLAVRALGGRITSGPAFCAELGGLAGSAATADLVVTGCDAFDFVSRGGGVVAEVAALAETALRPCVVLAATVQVGGREMRAMGVEAAYAVHEQATEPLDVADLRRLASRVARSWTW